MSTPDGNARASPSRPQANTPKVFVDGRRWQSAVKIPPEDWEKHKQTILVLWQTKSPDNVRKYMMDTYGFKATKRQYLYRLLKWGFSKPPRTNTPLDEPAHAVPDGRKPAAATDRLNADIAENGPEVAAASTRLLMPSTDDADNGPGPNSSRDMGAVPPSDNTEETDVAIVDEEEPETPSAAPTPWPESWYEGGMDLGLSQFAAQVMAEDNPGSPDGASPTHRPMAFHTAATDASTGDVEEGSPPGGPDSIASHTPQSGASSSGDPNKRARGGRDGNDDDGGDDSRGPKRRDFMGPPEVVVNTGPFYACPYQKRYPRESPLCGRPHGSKRESGWTTVSRVKQHLLECHGRDHHCSNCWRSYKKVEDATSCHLKKNCSKRQSPPKLWLSETEASQLRAEKVSNKDDDAWYRIFGLLFPDKEEHGPEGYRSKYTPYYSRVDHFLAASEFSSSSSGTSLSNRSPASMWTPSSNSTNSAGPTPLPSAENVSTMSPNEPEAISANPDSATWLSAYGYRDGHQGDTQLASTPGYPSSEGADPVLHAPPVPEPDPPTGPPPDLDAGPLILDAEGQLFDFHMGNTIPETPQITAATPEVLTLGPHVGVQAASCSCTFAPKCMCRLKKRNTELRTENETLRAALGGMRQTLDMQYELLQDMEDKSLLQGDVMERLWAYQDKMRAFLP